MITLARVKIWDTVVGVIAWSDSKGIATFEYDPNFIKKDWDLAPLTMPIVESRNGKRVFQFSTLNKETYKGLPGLVADSLPDAYGNRLIDAWLAQQGRSSGSLNPVERLCYIGKRGMGALEYEPATSPIQNISNSIEIKDLIKLANDILNERQLIKSNVKKRTSKALSDIIRVGTSAGGARAKAIIAYNETTGDVRSGQIDNLIGYDYWIIKFDGVSNKLLGDPKGYGKIEYAYYLMAINAGITMTYSTLLKENGRAHFMTKRFDREGSKKIHSQTLCALAHFDYNDSNSYSYEQAFECMRTLKLPATQMEEMYRRMVFNVIARNQDDHTKNITFLMHESGEWSLSPAYDVTYAYDPENKWMKAHQMSVNGKRDGITIKDLLAMASNMNIKRAEIIIKEVTAAVKHWPSFAKKAGVDKEQLSQIKKSFSFK